MGLLLLLIGGGWAVLGIANVFTGASNGLSPNWLAASLIFNGVLFVMPGLMVAGIGSLLRSRHAKKEA